MPKIVLHIGTHKTGTCTIQKYLTTNSQLLKENGILYFKPADTGAGLSIHHNISVGLLQKALKEHGIRYEFPSYLSWISSSAYFHSVEEYFVDLLAEMKSSGVDTALISSEAFFGTANVFCNCFFSDFPFKLDRQLASSIDQWIIDALRAMTAKFEVEVVVYLRRQDEHFQSLYSHHLRDYYPHLSVSEFLAKEPHRYDYHSVLDQWSECYGRESIRPRIFDKQALRRGLVNHFFNTCFQRELPEGSGIPENVNEHTHRALLDFRSVMLDRFHSDPTLFRIAYDFRHPPDDFELGRHEGRYLTAAQEQAFMDSLAESNRQLGQRYFGIDGSPFPEYWRVDHEYQPDAKAIHLLTAQFVQAISTVWNNERQAANERDALKEKTIETLNKKISEDCFSLEGLKGTIEALNKKLSEDRSSLESLKSTNQTLKEKLNGAYSSLEGLKKSASWRLTRPLRAFGGLGRKCVAAFSSLFKS